MKARGSLLAACAVLIALALPAGASARGGAHRRHVQVIQPTASAGVYLGTHDGYEVNLFLEEPDQAILDVSKYDLKRLSTAETKYGAHFTGSLVGGRVKADFGAVGSVDVRFRQTKPAKERGRLKACEGSPSRREFGRWTGTISLHGEGGYFDASSKSAAGERDRSFLLRCRFKHPLPLPKPESLRAKIEPRIGTSITALLLGTASSLEAEESEEGRSVVLWAAHPSGTKPGAEAEAGAFEYQGKMPVGRTVSLLHSPKGSLWTTLPGEHPARANLKLDAPFSGEAHYLTRSPTDHSWTGDLAVQFPGLAAPLTGPNYFTTLCVVSVLVKSGGCEFRSPSWQTSEEAATEGRR